MTLSIFYLDDDPTQLEVFREMFGAEYDVRTSDSIEEALRVLALCWADVVISDQLMPGVRGTDFLRAAARVCPGSYRVLLTGRLTVGEALPEVTSGAVHLFLRKPWTEGEVRRALERAAAYVESR